MTGPGGGGRPYVVLHVAVSLDGATTAFPVDVAAFYGLITTWDEDATLTGADTIIAQEAALTDGPGPNPDGPMLVVVDSKRRVSAWRALRDAGHWSRVVALRCQTSGAGRADVAEIVAGRDRVDLRAALHRLHGEGAVETVRVDSGGRLAGAMLDENLIDEISLLVHPRLVSASVNRWYGNHHGDIELELLADEEIANGVRWFRYRVTPNASG